MEELLKEILKELKMLRENHEIIVASIIKQQDEEQEIEEELGEIFDIPYKKKEVEAS